MAQITIVGLRANMEAELSTSPLLNLAPDFSYILNGSELSCGRTARGHTNTNSSFSTARTPVVGAGAWPHERPTAPIPSLCENPVLSTVKSLIFNAATAARLAFSHGLIPSLCENPVLSTVKSLIFNAATAARLAFSHGLFPG